MKLTINGRNIGELKNGVLIKKGKQVQKMYAMDGFGFPSELVNDCRVREVEVHYGGKVYKATTDELRKHGIPYKHPNYEPQIIMPVGEFRELVPEQIRML